MSVGMAVRGKGAAAVGAILAKAPPLRIPCLSMNRFLAVKPV